MLIRSQDKDRLISLDNISYLEMEYGYPAGDSCTIWATFDVDNQIEVGIYSSMDKAEAVLDEIAYNYERNKDAEYLGADGPHIRSSVFQMPEDDDPWFDGKEGHS